MIDELDTYTKLYNTYEPAYYTANKKITAEEWNGLWLAVVGQGNRQEDTLASILNITIPEVITNINDLITLGITNAFTNAEKEKLASLENYDDSALTQTVSDKADKVSSAIIGNFAGLDENGNLTDSGSKASDFLTSHQDIRGKVSTSGDTMTGLLLIENAPLKAFEIKNTTATGYARQMFTGDTKSFTSGVGNSNVSIVKLRNKYYAYNYTTSRIVFVGDENNVEFSGTVSVANATVDTEAVNKGQMDTAISSAITGFLEGGTI